MRIADYPPQPPLDAHMLAYHLDVLRRGASIAHEEFSYGRSPHQRLLVVPAESPTGVVLAFVHGGGWINGYKEWLTFMAPALGKLGVTFASIGYRLAPGTLFPDCFFDVVDGIAALHGKVKEFGGDPESFFLGGHSAGAQLASLAAVTDHWQSSRGLPADLVRGCLPVSGLFDFRPGNGMPVRPRFLGPPRSGYAEAASAIVHIKAPPPFLLAWGSRDFPHVRSHSVAMAGALRAAGGRVETQVFAGLSHMQCSLETGKLDGAWAGRAVRWMNRQLPR